MSAHVSLCPAYLADRASERSELFIVGALPSTPTGPSVILIEIDYRLGIEAFDKVNKFRPEINFERESPIPEPKRVLRV
jgi:hypothetical protein